MNALATPPLEAPDIHLVRAAEGWVELGLPDEAELELSQLSPAVREHPAVLDVRWQLHAARREWNLAHEAAELLVSLAPGELAGWIHRAYAARRMGGGGLQKAWDALRPAVELFPEEALVPYNLACYACQLGNLDSGRQWLSRAFETAAKRQLRAHYKTMALADADLAALHAEISR